MVSAPPQNVPWLTVPHGSTKKRQAADLVTSLKYAQRSSSYVFRGLSKRDYDLLPSIFRVRADGLGFDPKDEKIIFRVIKTEGMMFLERGDLSDIDLLALAQHFGSPTRLLDWTTNPLVALYFATFSGLQIDETVDGIVSVFKTRNSDFIREGYELHAKDDRGSFFPAKLFQDAKVRFIFPKFIDQRIINQKGLFSVQDDPTSTFVANCDKERISCLLLVPGP